MLMHSKNIFTTQRKCQNDNDDDKKSKRKNKKNTLGILR